MKLNKTILLITLVLLPQFVMCADKIVIDLKVPLVETADLAPAQAGATVYLMQSDWATISEVNEDVAVWLTDYERKKNILGQQVISLTLEVREPSGIRIGNLKQKKSLTVRYWISPSKSTQFEQQVLKDLEHLSQELKLEAYYLGVKIEDVLKALLD